MDLSYKKVKYSVDYQEGVVTRMVKKLFMQFDKKYRNPPFFIEKTPSQKWTYLFI